MCDTIFQRAGQDTGHYLTSNLLQTSSATVRLHPPETSKPNDCTADSDGKREHNSKETKVLAGWDVDVHAGEASGEAHGDI